MKRNSCLRSQGMHDSQTLTTCHARSAVIPSTYTVGKHLMYDHGPLSTSSFSTRQLDHLSCSPGVRSSSLWAKGFSSLVYHQVSFVSIDWSRVSYLADGVSEPYFSVLRDTVAPLMIFGCFCRLRAGHATVRLLLENTSPLFNIAPSILCFSINIPIVVGQNSDKRQ